LIDRLRRGQIERRVRLRPFPGASFEWRGEMVKLWRAAWRHGSGGAPGSLSRTPSGTPLMACGSDALELLELQRPGARRVSGAQWLRSQAGG
jgi:methionyl-tRNA formyltransferase